MVLTTLMFTSKGMFIQARKSAPPSMYTCEGKTEESDSGRFLEEGERLDPLISSAHLPLPQPGTLNQFTDNCQEKLELD